MPQCPFCQHENTPAADRCSNCGAALTTIAESRDENDQVSMPEENAVRPQSLEAEVKELFASHGKIEAIKYYRQRTGAGLAEAKQAVEAIAEGTSSSGAVAGADLADQIEPLLRNGNVIGAIKLYRERTGVGLKQAKDDVEALARGRNIPLKQVGCGATALLLLAIALVVSVLLALVIPVWF
jgi:large subunit ribosomal protein L7/L12